MATIPSFIFVCYCIFVLLVNICFCCVSFNFFGKKCKGFSYSLLSVGPGADPGVQAVSLQVTVS